MDLGLGSGFGRGFPLFGLAQLFFQLADALLQARALQPVSHQARQREEGHHQDAADEGQDQDDGQRTFDLPGEEGHRDQGRVLQEEYHRQRADEGPKDKKDKHRLFRYWLYRILLFNGVLGPVRVDGAAHQDQLHQAPGQYPVHHHGQERAPLEDAGADRVVLEDEPERGQRQSRQRINEVGKAGAWIGSQQLQDEAESQQRFQHVKYVPNDPGRGEECLGLLGRGLDVCLHISADYLLGLLIPKV